MKPIFIVLLSLLMTNGALAQQTLTIKPAPKAQQAVQTKVIKTAENAIRMSITQQANLHITTASVQAPQQLSSPSYPAEVIVPANQIQLITSPYAGLITRVLVNAGQAVKKGQALAVITSMDLMGLQREYAQLSAQTQLSEQTLTRDSLLFKEGIIAEKRLQESQAKRAEILAKQAEYQQIFAASGILNKGKSNVYQNRLTISAPRSGVVSNLTVSQGQRIDAMTPLMNVVQLQPLWLDIQVPLLDIKHQKIQKGMGVAVQDFDARGVVTALIPNVNAQTQTAIVRAEVRNTDGLFPSQMVDVRLKSSAQSENATSNFAINSQALVLHLGETIVFVQTNTGFKAVPVDVINTQGDITLIKAAFDSKTQVAITGTASLKAQLAGFGGQE